MSNGLTADWAPGGTPGAPAAPAAQSAQVVRAPRGYLLVAVAAGVLSLVLSALPLEPVPGLPVWIVGWVLAAVIGLGGACLFSLRDARAQVQPFYVPVASTGVLYAAAIVLGLLGDIATAARIALVVGRM
jgi:hypothetical protein